MAYLEPCRTSKIEHFERIIYGSLPLTFTDPFYMFDKVLNTPLSIFGKTPRFPKKYHFFQKFTLTFFPAHDDTKMASFRSKFGKIPHLKTISLIFSAHDGLVAMQNLKQDFKVDLENYRFRASNPNLDKYNPFKANLRNTLQERLKTKPWNYRLISLLFLVSN